eukprot:SAG31_NODE_5292_length_2628_cov_1.807434_4_plen_59_part_00
MHCACRVRDGTRSHAHCVHDWKMVMPVTVLGMWVSLVDRRMYVRVCISVVGIRLSAVG